MLAKQRKSWLRWGQGSRAVRRSRPESRMREPAQAQERKPLKLLVAGGGTGGHVFPALAVAKEWLARGPEREVVFVGTERGLENRLVPEAGIPLEKIRSAGLKGMGLAKLAHNLSMLPGAFRDSSEILKRHHFAAAFGMGGYASGPVILLAAMKKIPVVIFQPNAAAGFTNRILVKFATRAATGYEQLAKRWGKKAVTTGCPVREEFQYLPPRKPVSPFRILITGGSQGARPLNRAIDDALPHLAERRDDLILVHQTGDRDYEDVRGQYAQHELTAQVKRFLDDMPERLAWADLVICRAGQITISEIATVGRPAIFIPFAAAADNHQLRNAQALERAGAARIVQEKDLTGERLAKVIFESLADPARLAEQGRRAHRFARPEATRDIVNLIEQVARP